MKYRTKKVKQEEREEQEQNQMKWARIALWIFTVLFAYFVGLITPTQANETIVYIPDDKQIPDIRQLKLHSYQSPQEQIKTKAIELCTARGFGEYCVKDLQGIAWKETKYNCQAVGDGGYSFGCFQIYTRVHKHIMKDQAESIDFATEWTLDYLVTNGYPKYRSHAIRKHNGNPFIQQTQDYLNDINNYIITNL